MESRSTSTSSRSTPWTPARCALLAVCLGFSCASFWPTPAWSVQAEGARSEKQNPPPEKDSEAEPEKELPKEHRDWLEEVSVLMTEPELQVFLELDKDYQRNAFKSRFWEERDPYPESARNELKERWAERVQFARGNFDSLSDARSQVWLLHGEPARRVEIRCTTTRIPAEIWLYNRIHRQDVRALLVFTKSRGVGKASLWQPRRALSSTLVESTRGCINGGLLEEVIESITAQGSDYEISLARVLTKPPLRSREWLAAFSSDSTELPAGWDPFPADVSFDFLGRNQSRTVLQVEISVDPEDVEPSDLAGYRSYDFQVLGEIVIGDQLLEGFRYKFGFPLTSELQSSGRLPMAFVRYLRPGDYTLVLRIEDLNSGRFYRLERALAVPKVDHQYVAPGESDSETARLFAEAAENALSGDDSIRLRRPTEGSGLKTGFVRFNADVTGSSITKAVFLLDDREILTKNAPPFNVEIDLGEFPRLHNLRVEGMDSQGKVIAVDELPINAGGSRFTIRLVEPRRAQRFKQSVRARADVQVPDGEVVDRVEFFRNETLVATLFQAPFVQPIQLAGGGTPEYIRSVAYLKDGNSAEDLVFVNAEEVLERVEVQFVELFASVTDRNGRPMAGLKRSDFVIQEDGARQEISRFAKVEDMPIHVGVLIDNSASMKGAVDTTRLAALSFFQNAITSRDRAAVITFNRFPRLAVKLTSDLTALGGGLAGLTAEGQTALYDSIMFALYYFGGITGQRAILILSDGKDEASRFSWEDTLEYARRAGITIYSIGLGIQEANSRRKLATLADETGGRSYFIKRPSELDEIYSQVEREMRSQYLLAYQSSNTSVDGAFRKVTVKAEVPGADVKTMSGYYP
jgi:VWFA-related protein